MTGPQICKFSATDQGYCETHECRFDDVDLGDAPVEFRDGDTLIGDAARKYRQALHHVQQVGFHGVTDRTER